MPDLLENCFRAFQLRQPRQVIDAQGHRGHHQVSAAEPPDRLPITRCIYTECVDQMIPDQYLGNRQANGGGHRHGGELAKVTEHDGIPPAKQIVPSQPLRFAAHEQRREEDYGLADANRNQGAVQAI
ncbi:hypothetical protein D3C81_1383170 [compost metagenome]